MIRCSKNITSLRTRSLGKKSKYQKSLVIMEKNQSRPLGREKPEGKGLVPRGNSTELRARAQDSAPKTMPYVSGGGPGRPRRVRKV